MSTGAITAIVVIGVIVIAVAAALALRPQLRSRQLKRRFGPEYDRAVAVHGGAREAEKDLEDRLRRHRDLDVKPLSAEARAAYLDRWADTQARFVDAPAEALTAADQLISEVLHARGYPVGEHDETLSALSVRHARTLQNYRQAHEVARRAEQGTATTEELREAVVRIRGLFEELVEAGSDGAAPRRRLAEQRSAPARTQQSRPTTSH